MSQCNINNPSTQRLYGVEFLRIIFIFCIIFFHATPNSEYLHKYLALFHTSFHHLAFAVDYFFIIGGFFLLKNLSHAAGGKSVFQHIQKLWWRLVPGLLFIFVILCAIDEGVSWRRFIVCLFNVQGFGLAPEVTGWADYFIGSYFFISCFLVSLFTFYKDSAWLILGVACCLLISFQLHVKPMRTINALGGVYFSSIGSGLVRGFVGMSLGAFGAFLSENIRLPHRFGVRFLTTVFEVLALIISLGYLTSPANFRFTALEIKCTFIILLILISWGTGYLSAFLNRMSWLMYLSRYTYSFLLGQIVLMHCMRTSLMSSLSIDNKAIIAMGGILLGLIEYHLIERFLVPRIRAYLSYE